MKNREKFLLIFMVTTIILTIFIVIKGNIDIKNITKEMEFFWSEFNKGEISGKHSDEIEDGIKQHMMEDYNERDMAVQSYLAAVMMDNNLRITNISPRVHEIINLIFCSLSITLFIYFMITVEYKNKKQYILTNIGVFGILLLLQFVNNLLFLNGFKNWGEPILFYHNGYYYMQELLPLLYIVFLTGNAIKNKKRLQIFNVMILDIIVAIDAIYNAITTPYLAVHWEDVIGLFIIILAVEVVILGVRKQIIKGRITKDEKK